MEKSLYDTLIKCTKKIPNSTNFNPLTDPKTVEDVVDGVVNVLEKSENNKQCLIMRKLRIETINFVRRKCCLRNGRRSKVNLMIKNGILNTKCEKVSEKEMLYKELDLYMNLGVNDNCKISLEIGSALLNINSEYSNKAVQEMTKSLLLSSSEVNDQSLEFLQKVWQSDHIKLDCKLLGSLAEKIVPEFESKLLKTCTELLNIDLIKSYDDLIAENFDNENLLITRLGRSSHFFQIFFRILSDLFMKSNFDKNIREFASHIHERVYYECTNQQFINLYPHNLQSAVFFLQSDRRLLQKSKPLYSNLIAELRKLKTQSRLDFVMLLLHYKDWIEDLNELL